MGITLGDCLEELRKIASASVDSLVTDPPAGISFMGKAWDDDKGGRDEWIKWLSEVMRECRRVLKPGAHALVWAIPRTSHWTATAIEDAGFEIRDVVTHLFGSGFPKSLDVSKAIDKAAGAEREVVAEVPHTTGIHRNHSLERDEWKGGQSKQGRLANDKMQITAPSTDLAKQWQGWGTALKPAAEFWILARNPLVEKTVAANVCKHGTGALNIDASRIICNSETEDLSRGKVRGESNGWDSAPAGKVYSPSQGRFPANLVLSHSPECDEACAPGCPVAELDGQSGQTRGGTRGREVVPMWGLEENGSGLSSAPRDRNDSGGASRFFATFKYCAKVSPSERNAGLEGMPEAEGRRNFSSGMEYKLQANGNKTSPPEQRKSKNTHHPTVKPLKLMRYLIRLITPPGGLVLDPFAGSGSTGVAAIQEGFEFLGIERENEYVQIAQARIAHANQSKQEELFK